MPPIGPISRRDLIANFRKLGWSGPHPGSTHAYLSKGGRDQRIPNAHHGDISTPMLREILRQAGISRAEWERLYVPGDGALEPVSIPFAIAAQTCVFRDPGAMERDEG